MFFVPFLRGLARPLQLVCLALATLPAVLAQTNSPSAADGFDPNIDGIVYAMARQQNDGKIVVVGQFANVQPNGGISVNRNNIVRLNPDGSFDPDFNPNANGPIRAVLIQPEDGKIVVGGDFTSIGGQDRAYVARLNADGTVDTTFTAGVGKSTDPERAFTPQVTALARDPEGNIYVGGTFGTAKSGTSAAVTRNNLVRFNSAGVLDATWDPNPNAIVLALAMHRERRDLPYKLLVGGAFTKFQENGSSTTTERLRIARLNPDGTVDSEFDPKANDGVATILVQPDDKIVLGGFFTTLFPRGSTNAENRSRIARLNPSGTIDTEFFPTIGGNVLALALAPDGSILVGGRFSQLFGRGNVSVPSPFAARLLPDGTPDESFVPRVNSDVTSFALQADGKVIMGGYFTRAIPAGTSTQVVRNHIARVLPTGALDTTFELVSSGRVLASVVDKNNKLIVGGTFTNLGGVTRFYLARLNTDGTVDSTYTPRLNGPVYAMAYDSAADKVYIGGGFTAVGHPGDISERTFLARLNPDGSVDSEYNVKFNGQVATLLLQDGNLIVGGTFTTVQQLGNETAYTRGNLVKLSAVGAVDAAWNPNTNGAVVTMAAQGDKKLLIGGKFTALQPGATGTVHTRSNLARLNTDGTVDTAYNPGLSASATAILIQDEKAIVGGEFQAVIGTNETQPTTRFGIARFNTDGTVDKSFDPKANNVVISLAQQADKKILVGGTFTTFTPNGGDVAKDWKQAKYIGRLETNGTVDVDFNLDLNEQNGNRVDHIAVLPSGDILLSGNFVSLKPPGSSTRVVRNHLALVRSSGQLVDTWDPRPTGSMLANVKAISLQPDGKVIAGGSFSDLGGTLTPNIARFNSEGTPDFDFNAALSTDAVVNAIAVRANAAARPTQLGGFAWLENNGQLRTSFAPSSSAINIKGRINAAVELPDKSVILAGAFSDLTNKTKGNIVKLRPDGTVDTAFSVNVAAIFGAALTPDKTKLYIYGAFVGVSGSSMQYIARIDVNTGAVDTAFNPFPNEAVNSIVVQNDGSVVLAGSFTSLNPGGNTNAPATTRNYAARVTSAGAIDDRFNPNLNGVVYSAALQGEKVVLVGKFTSATPTGDTSATTRNGIVRINADGSLDRNFDPNANDAIYAVAVQPGDNKILVGGDFSQIAGQSHRSIARLNEDGTGDSTYTPAANGTVTSLTVAPDKSVLVGGFFTTITSAGATTPVARFHFARLTEAGVLDPAFNPDLAGLITNAFIASDGSIMVGGTFTSINPIGLILVGGEFRTIGGVTQSYVAQLNGDGSVDATFRPTVDGAVAALLPLPDGRFLIGGTFTSVNGTARAGIARFSAAGELDPSFNPTLGAGGVASLALQPDGKVLVGVAGLQGLVRLNTDGSLDSSFTAGAALIPAVAIAVQPDGKIVAAGAGSGVPTRVVRLNPDGSLDSSFTAASFNAGGRVSTLTLQSDGRIIVAGTFSTISGTAITNLARLTATGAVDPSFNPAPNGPVEALALQNDGRLFIGGQFSQVGALQRSSLARLAAKDTATSVLGVSSDGRTITWLRSGASADLFGVTFEMSQDGQTWTVLGAGTRVGGRTDWQITNVTVPTTGNVFLRARGIVPTSAGTSTGVYEVRQLVNLATATTASAAIVAPVISSNVWDTSHYVWTQDSAGVLRIADIYSFVTFESGKTVLINGGSVGGKPSASMAKLADLSTRGVVNASSPLISGFALAGTSSRQVLIRAAGPALAPFGVSNPLAQPELVLYRGSQELQRNQGWNSNLLPEFARLGAFPFAAGSADAAFVVTLEPGTYTVRVADGGNGSGGDTLVEVYDAGSLTDSATRLVNLSTRGTVNSNAALIGGLYVSGDAAKTMLVRGVGPALTRYGVGGALSDPKITVYDGNGTVVATNNDWEVRGVSIISQADYGAAVASGAAEVGAFALDRGSKDAALIITLQAGAYTVQLTGVDGAAGAGMIEVYELP